MGLPIYLAGVVNHGDVRMIHRGLLLSLIHEPLTRLPAVSWLGQLDSDDAAQGPVKSPKHDPHAPLAYARFQRVSTEFAR
jgi:hypothetical protein